MKRQRVLTLILALITTASFAGLAPAKSDSMEGDSKSNSNANSNANAKSMDNASMKSDASMNHDSKQGESANSFARAIAKAQGAKRFKSHQAMRVPITVHFAGKMVIDGTILMSPDMSRIRITQDDGLVLVHSGDQSWIAPADYKMNLLSARFNVKTWPYFLSVPFKLDDPGVNIKPMGEKKLDGETYQTAKMTFDSGVGDSSDDWYQLYRDEKTNHLKAMVYIVTFGSSAKKAAKSPHAIIYKDFTTVDGVTLPTHWVFRHWSEKKGVHGKPIGDVKVGKIKFVKPGPDAFAKPEDARRAMMPGKKKNGGKSSKKTNKSKRKPMKKDSDKAMNESE